MPTQIAHNGGLVDAILELGFDALSILRLPPMVLLKS